MWTVVHRRLGASCTLGGLHQRVRTAKCASQELVGQLHGVWVHGDDEVEPRGRRGVVPTPCSVLRKAAPTAAVSPGQRGIHTAAQPHGGKDSADSSNGDGAEAPQSFAQRWFGPQTGHADASFTNRWAMALPAFFTHLCIGSPYSWSVVSGPLSREMGFVTSAADDWSLAACSAPLSLVFVLQGIAAAVGGKWQMRVGHRAAMLASAACFGGGLMLAGAGIASHQLWMLYLGYGVMAGTGVGVGYTPPVQALIEWFPDRKGLASSLAIAGFGSGALVFAPLMNNLSQAFAKMPTYLGAAGSVDVHTRDGRLFASVDGADTEVVMANAKDLAALPYDLLEGIYVVGSGCTGVAPALAVCGGLFGATLFTCAMTMQRPHKSYRPAGYDPEAAAQNATTANLPAGNVHVSEVMKTPQYISLGAVFFCLASGGMGLFTVAKPMVTEVFASSMPNLVTAAFAGMYVNALSVGNLGGRLGWGALSDKIGRRNTFWLFTLGSIPLYLAMPYLVEEVTTTGAALPLYGFIGTTVVAVSFMGGMYAILPAYEADTFGPKYVGPNHGRMLLWSSLACMVGPATLLTLRQRSTNTAIAGLLEKVDEDEFVKTFGVGTDQAQPLIEAKTLTISKLMEVVPSGTQDPSPFIYNSTLYTMAGLAAVAAGAHYTMGPVHPKHFEVLPEEQGVVVDAEYSEVDQQDTPTGHTRR